MVTYMYREHDASSGLRRVALHESGHVVVAIAQGRRIEAVTIIPGRDYDGKVSEAEEPEMMKALLDFMSGGRADAKVEATARSKIVGYVAGQVSEWCFCPKESWRSDRHHVSGSDMKLARLFAMAITGSEESAEALLSSSRTQARQILLAHRQLVEAIADALIRHGTMTGAEIEIILKDREP
jgi:ATP-dependent Zn protease